MIFLLLLLLYDIIIIISNLLHDIIIIITKMLPKRWILMLMGKMPCFMWPYSRPPGDTVPLRTENLKSIFIINVIVIYL